MLLFLITPTNQIEPRSKLNGKNPFQAGLSSKRMNLFNFGKPKKAGGRRVLHSSNEEWISSFERKLGSISSTMAKLWALKMAFSLARQLNLENVNIESDVEVLVYMLFNLLCKSYVRNSFN